MVTVRNCDCMVISCSVVGPSELVLGVMGPSKLVLEVVRPNESVPGKGSVWLN